LVVTESFGIGGTETHLIRVLPRLAASGWDIVAFCLTERGQRAETLERAGIKVLAPARSATTRPRVFRHAARVGRALTGLFQLMRRWRPDIVHFYLPGPYLIGAPIAIAARVPITIMSRRSLSCYQQRWPLVARLERLLHGRMDAVTGNSQAVVRDLLSEGAPKNKIKLIYNGIDCSLTLPDREQARRTLDLPPQAVVGIVIANIVAYKGHRELIEGLASVARQLPADWRVLCVGRDHGRRSTLERLAETRGLAAHIRFVGERLDVSEFFAAADFSVLSSWEEGFSNVILESMAAGLPMIVTAVGGNPEAVLDEKTGLVVPPRDAAAIGRAVLRLSLDADLRRRLGQAARVRVQQEFSIEACVAAHNELYEGLLAQAVPIGCHG